MKDLPAQYVALVEASRTRLLVAYFAKTNSPSYELAVNVAKGAARYEEFTVGKAPVHIAEFNTDYLDAGRALTVVRYISGWKSAYVFANGRPLHFLWPAVTTLACYVKSFACRDCRAHCFVTVDGFPMAAPQLDSDGRPTPAILAGPDTRERFGGKFVFPCKLLQPYFWFDRHHPAAVADQIQAAAVSNGCDWCPHFSADNYHPAG